MLTAEEEAARVAAEEKANKDKADADAVAAKAKAKADADAKAAEDAKNGGSNLSQGVQNAARIAATSPNLTPQQIKDLEEASGFNIKQLTTMGIMIQNSQAQGPIGKAVEDQVFSQAKLDLMSLGVTDFAVYEADLKADLAKRTPAERQNLDLVKNLFWITKGPKSVGQSSSSSNSGRVLSGVESGGETEIVEKSEQGDFNKLSDYEKSVYRRYGFTSMKDWKEKGGSKVINMSHENNWEPRFK